MAVKSMNLLKTWICIRKQSDFVRRLGTSKQFISNLENRIRPKSRKMAIARGKEFGVTQGRFREG